MKDPIKQYTVTIRKHLHCGGTLRKDLLSQFQNMLSDFREDNPTPTYSQLVAAFGPPEDMADVLMAEISNETHIAFHRTQKFLKIFAGIALAFFIGFTIFTYFIKDVTVITVKDELIPLSTSSQEGS